MYFAGNSSAEFDCAWSHVVLLVEPHFFLACPASVASGHWAADQTV